MNTDPEDLRRHLPGQLPEEEAEQMETQDLRRYLLGQLAEEEAERMEARLLEDDEVSELAEIVEEELLIEHFRGELPEGRDLALRLLASAAGRQRVEFARALAGAMPRPLPSRRYVRYAMPAAAAAAMVGVVVGLGIYHQTAPPPAPPKQAKAPVSRGGEPPPAVLSLALITLRGGEEAIPPLALAPEQTRVELRLRLPSGETFPSYRVSLPREDGSQVPHELKTDVPGFLIVLVRAADLPSGRYEGEAYGLRGQGEPELLGPVAFQVVRNAKSQ